jgi:hypothetical protein
MRGAAPSYSLALYAKDLRLINNYLSFRFKGLVFQESFLRSLDKKTNFSVKIEE